LFISRAVCACLSAADRVCPRQAFEGLDREGRGFLTAEGIKQVVGLDFDTEEVGRKRRTWSRWMVLPSLPALLAPASSCTMRTTLQPTAFVDGDKTGGTPLQYHHLSL